jgi:Phage integrase family
VIAGHKPGAHLVELQKPWRRIREKASLHGLRIHDLRHSFASTAAGMGMSLPMIGKLLGHSQPATTARYAHLAADPVLTASDLVGNEIMAAMNGGTKKRGQEAGRGEGQIQPSADPLSKVFTVTFQWLRKR